jgi:predicted transglutaminase-like cysteine proteinase
MRAIDATNRDINWRIRPRSDLQIFGMADYWTLPLANGARGDGDCEDFVLQKRSSLRKSGYALTMMSIAIVEAPSQQTHAVLLLNTDRGVLVLDNLEARIRPLSKTPYRVISREEFGAPLKWRAGVGSGDPSPL